MFSHWSTAAGLFGALLIVIAGAGCAPQETGFVLVRGKIRLAGRPLTNGHVSFRPDASKGNETLHHPTGTLSAAGEYELMTAGEMGAPPGWYKVLVFSDENQAAGVVHPHLPKWAIAEKYTREETTDLRVEVKREVPDDAYDLEVSR